MIPRLKPRGRENPALHPVDVSRYEQPLRDPLVEIRNTADGQGTISIAAGHDVKSHGLEIA